MILMTANLIMFFIKESTTNFTAKKSRQRWIIYLQADKFLIIEKNVIKEESGWINIVIACQPIRRRA